MQTLTDVRLLLQILLVFLTVYQKRNMKSLVWKTSHVIFLSSHLITTLAVSQLSLWQYTILLLSNSKNSCLPFNLYFKVFRGKKLNSRDFKSSSSLAYLLGLIFHCYKNMVNVYTKALRNNNLHILHFILRTFLFFMLSKEEKSSHSDRMPFIFKLDSNEAPV